MNSCQPYLPWISELSSIVSYTVTIYSLHPLQRFSLLLDIADWSLVYFRIASARESLFGFAFFGLGFKKAQGQDLIRHGPLAAARLGGSWHDLRPRNRITTFTSPPGNSAARELRLRIEDRDWIPSALAGVLWCFLLLGGRRSCFLRFRSCFPLLCSHWRFGLVSCAFSWSMYLEHVPGACTVGGLFTVSLNTQRWKRACTLFFLLGRGLGSLATRRDCWKD